MKYIWWEKLILFLDTFEDFRELHVRNVFHSMLYSTKFFRDYLGAERRVASWADFDFSDATFAAASAMSAGGGLGRGSNGGRINIPLCCGVSKAESRVGRGGEEGSGAAAGRELTWRPGSLLQPPPRVACRRRRRRRYPSKHQRRRSPLEGRDCVDLWCGFWELWGGRACCGPEGGGREWPWGAAWRRAGGGGRAPKRELLLANCFLL